MTMDVDQPKPANNNNNSRRTGRRRNNNRTQGGVAKLQQQPQQPRAAQTSAASKAAGRPAAKADTWSEIIIKNWPKDVSEQNIKNYLASLQLPFKTAKLSYNQNGKSTGLCTVSFNNLQAALKMATSLDGAFVDGRPLEVKVTQSPSSVETLRREQDLQNRVILPSTNSAPQETKPKAKSQPKNQNRPISAAEGKKKDQKQRERRPKNPRKTVAQLDQEMHDYFHETNAGQDQSAVQAPAQPDQMME